MAASLHVMFVARSVAESPGGPGLADGSFKNGPKHERLYWRLGVNVSGFENDSTQLSIVSIYFVVVHRKLEKV